MKEEPYIVLPLSRVFSGKWRLVVDASRGLNPFCKQRGIRLEDLTHVSRTLQQGDWMVVNDLDSGYWHVPIHPDHWCYLGVHHVDEDGTTTFWVWKVLCLGLRDAAHLFTRLIRPIMADLRRRGMKGLIYIDDKWTVAASFQACLEMEVLVKEKFAACGWVFKPSKRSGDPSQVVRFLGLLVDSRDMTFSIPEDKIERIIQGCWRLLSGKWTKVRKVASLVGLLQSVRLATGPIVGVMTRSLNRTVDAAARWSSFVRLDELARFETIWWWRNIRSVSKYPIPGTLSSTKVGVEEVASDGSGVGHFSYSVDGGVRLAGRPYSSWERRQSSTYRELLAFHETWTCEEVLRKFEGRMVTHLTDSKAMCYIVEKGSRNPKLHPMVVEVTLALREWRIKVEARWKSREEGIIRIADLGSRDYHEDDVSLDFDTFMQVVERFGVFDVDCFASSFTKKAVRFFSRLDVLGTAGVDFFLQELREEDNHWVFPPPGKLCEATLHLREQGVAAVMVVPVWPASSFYSFFWPDGRHCAEFVEDMMIVQPHFVCGPLVRSKSFRGRRSFYTAVFKVSFRGKGSKRLHRSRVERLLCLEGGCRECC